MSEATTPTDAINQDASSGTENQEGSAGTPSQESEKTYTQADVDKILESRLGRQKKSISKNYEQQIQSHAEQALAQWREEHGLSDEALEKFQTIDKSAHEIRTAKYEAAKATKALEAQVEMVSTLESALRRERVDKAILAAAASKANNPDEIVHLLKSRVDVDPDNGYEPFVIDDKGESTGQTISELVVSYLENNPHHLKPVAGVGSGSKAAPMRSSKSAPAEQDTRENRLELLRKGGLF